MPIALHPHETWKYQLLEDRLPDGKVNPKGTIWRLKSIPAWVQAQIQDEIKFQGEELCPNRGTIMRLLLENGVDGVENWQDAQGHDVVLTKRGPPGREVVDLEFLDRLLVHHRTELANAIDNRTKITLEEGN